MTQGASLALSEDRGVAGVEESTARGFPTATAEKSTAAEPPARPQAASCSACRNAMPVKSRVDRRGGLSPVVPSRLWWTR